MRAMILAAGRGERMGDLTLSQPKPLLRVAGKYLIEYAITTLVKANIRDIVINVSYCREQIMAALGNGKKYDVNIAYSEEEERLETGGGIRKALPLLGNDPFLVMSSDIITDFPLSRLPLQPKGLGHLVLVNNPSYHPQGDFSLDQDYLALDASSRFTFANIGVFRKELFLACEETHFRLGKLLLPAASKKQLTGELYKGLWYNLGTQKDLEDIHNLHALPA